LVRLRDPASLAVPAPKSCPAQVTNTVDTCLSVHGPSAWLGKTQAQQGRQEKRAKTDERTQRR
jgi:hypothetical protein